MTGKQKPEVRGGKRLLCICVDKAVWGCRDKRPDILRKPGVFASEGFQSG